MRSEFRGKKWQIGGKNPVWIWIPLACTCKVCYPSCLCQCTLLLASLFDPEIRVPAHYIAATPSLCKACRGIKGTAGYKRRKLIEAAACDEKKVSSKVGYMTGTKRAKGPAAAPVLPEPASPPASDSSDFQVPV